MNTKVAVSTDTRAVEASTETKIPKWMPLVCFILPFLLYVNTLGHGFTQDDAIVIYDNMYTQQGIAGLPGIFSKDTFHGFFKEEGKAKLVSGGRYRPFTLALFAVEIEIFGMSPAVGHFFNVFWFSSLCMLLFFLLQKVLASWKADAAKWIALSTTLIFASHPIHTEVVANIKGRDEIFALLGALGAMWFVLRYAEKGGILSIIGACVSFFIGLMSKENTITFLAVIPMAMFLLLGKKTWNAYKPVAFLLISTFVFLLIRTSVIGADFGGTPRELMNNPYLKWNGSTYVDFTSGEKLATILVTLLEYLRLLIFPYKLTHDYYPMQISIASFGDWKVLLSIAIHFGLAIFSLMYWRKWPIASFVVLSYFATMSITSNLFFPIGTHMSERFLFTPSVFFSLILAIGIFRLMKSKQMATLMLTGLISLPLLAKTIQRNTVWKDDFTLFQTDVNNSPNSAKVRNAAGGSLITKAEEVEDPKQKQEMYAQAITHLQKALELHPTYRNAALLLGNAHFFRNEFELSIAAYRKALSFDPNYQEAANNLAVALQEAGRYAGEVEQDLVKAERYLSESLKLAPEDPKTNRLMGIVHGISGRHEMAIQYFAKVVQILPNEPSAYDELATAYGNAGNIDKMNELRQKANELKNASTK